MKTIKELGLEIIQLEDQVLLVNNNIGGNSGWNYNYAIEKIENLVYSYDQYSSEARFCKKIIASTKPLKGLPLLVIEDNLTKDYMGSDSKSYYDFKIGYNKAKENTISFEDEFDLGNKIRLLFLKHGNDSWLSIARDLIDYKKELWIEVEEKEYPVSSVSFDSVKFSKFHQPLIKNNQIKAVWK